ncbi:hemolymph lipopolysaccharide-binding protein-like [Anabrus simplex]|uniref:hemolymph lipopolysaccharide-binding protein-like n=1 Tax=Anabrus simplex TaxID=316456 RepID=UPI0035A37930
MEADVDERGLTLRENQRKFVVNVGQERRPWVSSREIEHVVSVHPPLYDMDPVTPSTSTSATTTIKTTKRNACPRGYRQFKHFNCYKGYKVPATWGVARDQCKRDGADLMVAETEQERKEVFYPMYMSTHPGLTHWLGIYKLEHEDRWISVRGEPARSSWWRPRLPDDIPNDRCGTADSTGRVANRPCDDLWPYLCEFAL